MTGCETSVLTPRLPLEVKPYQEFAGIAEKEKNHYENLNKVDSHAVEI